MLLSAKLRYCAKPKSPMFVFSCCAQQSISGFLSVSEGRASNKTFDPRAGMENEHIKNYAQTRTSSPGCLRAKPSMWLLARSLDATLRVGVRYLLYFVLPYCSIIIHTQVADSALLALACTMKLRVINTR